MECHEVAFFRSRYRFDRQFWEHKCASARLAVNCGPQTLQVFMRMRGLPSVSSFCPASRSLRVCRSRSPGERGTWDGESSDVFAASVSR